MLVDLTLKAGFRQHDFALVRNPSLVPGEAILELSHNARGDTGTWLVSSIEGFDLSSLGTDPLTVRLVNYEPTLRYEGVPAPRGRLPDPLPLAIGAPPTEAQALVRARDVRVAGDELLLKASYSQLAGMDSKLSMSWNGAFAETFPVTAELRLSREQSGTRTALAFLPFEQPVRVDLSSLKDAYARAYGASEGARINLQVWSTGESTPQSANFDLRF